MYLYRAVDSEGNTIDFYLSKNRKAKSAKRFFKKALASCHATIPRVVTVNKHRSYPKAVKLSKKEDDLSECLELKQINYLNNMVEQNHRFIKKLVRPMLGFQSFQTATKILASIEAMHMIKKVKLLKGRSLSKNRWRYNPSSIRFIGIRVDSVRNMASSISIPLYLHQNQNSFISSKTPRRDKTSIENQNISF